VTVRQAVPAPNVNSGTLLCCISYSMLPNKGQGKHATLLGKQYLLQQTETHSWCNSQSCQHLQQKLFYCTPESPVSHQCLESSQNHPVVEPEQTPCPSTPPIPLSHNTGPTTAVVATDTHACSNLPCHACLLSLPRKYPPAKPTCCWTPIPMIQWVTRQPPAALRVAPGTPVHLQST